MRRRGATAKPNHAEDKESETEVITAPRARAVARKAVEDGRPLRTAERAVARVSLGLCEVSTQLGGAVTNRPGE